MSVATLTNCRPRKQLADQLDRLDSILDGLSEALNEAVADASKEGVRAAVKEAVVELLTNPDLRTALHHASTPDAEPKPTFWQRLKAKASRVVTRVKEVATGVAVTIVHGVSAAGAAVSRTLTKARDAVKNRGLLRLAIAMTVFAAAVRYVAAHGVGSFVADVRSTLSRLFVRIGEWTSDVFHLRLTAS